MTYNLFKKNDKIKNMTHHVRLGLKLDLPSYTRHYAGEALSIQYLDSIDSNGNKTSQKFVLIDNFFISNGLFLLEYINGPMHSIWI